MSMYKGQFTVSKYSELGYGVKFQSLNSNKRSNFVWEVWEQMESLESWTKRLNIETYKEQG